MTSPVYLLSERQLPIDDALRIAREVADALGEALSHGIVHRDIKPENYGALRMESNIWLVRRPEEKQP